MKIVQEEGIKEQKRIKKSYLYTAFLFLILFGIYQYGIHQIYGMVEYPDEFGYWSTAASMIGWDWSQIASRSSYYSFGYSLILLPILKFCEDSVTAYRMAVTVNFSLITVSFFLLKGIYKRIFTEQVEGEEILAIGMTLLYPAWSFYAQTTLVDSLLMFMVILICYLWIRFIEVPKLRWGFALVVAVMYNYSLHMRSAGIVVAVVIVMLLWVWKHPSYWKKILPLLLGVVGIFLIIVWIKGMVQGNVFAGASAETLNVNDFGGQWDKIAFLFSIEGLQQLFIVTMGKVLYIGIASGGLVYAAVVWCGEQVAEWWRRAELKNRGWGVKDKSSEWIDNEISNVKEIVKNREHIRWWFGVFFLLFMLGQLAVCIIYTIHTNNVDWLIYGRYIEAFIPMGIFVGAAYTLQKKQNIKVQVGFGILYTWAALSCICKVWGQTSDHIRGEHSVATIFLSGDGNVKSVCFLISVWIAGMLLMSLMTVGLHWFKEQRCSLGIIVGIFCLFAVWSIHASERYTYKGNDNISGERIVVNVLKEQLEKGKEIYYLEEGNGDWICFIQMQLKEKTLPVIAIEDLFELDSTNLAVVVDGESKYLEYMEENYNRRIAGSYHYVFYEN